MIFSLKGSEFVNVGLFKIIFVGEGEGRVFWATRIRHCSMHMCGVWLLCDPFLCQPTRFLTFPLLFRGTTFSPTDRGIRDVAQQLKSMNLIPDTKARKRKACMYKMYTVGTTSVCTVTHACIAYTCTHMHTHAHTCIAYTMHSCVYVSVQHVCYYMYVYTASEIAYNKVIYASCRRF